MSRLQWLMAFAMCAIIALRWVANNEADWTSVPGVTPEIVFSWAFQTKAELVFKT